MSYGKRTCLQCGVEFEAAYIAQLCCTPACQKRRRQDGKNASARKRRTSRREEIAVMQRKMGKLRAALERIASRKRFLNRRCAELVEQVSKQGAEIIALRSKLANAEGLLQTADEITARLHEEKGALKKELAAAPVPPAAKKAPEKKSLDAKLKAAKEQVKAELSLMHECKRMKVRGTSLPCGKRVECFEVTRCEHVPAGMRLEL